MENIDKEKTLDYLKQYKDDPEQLEALKEAIATENFFVDSEGMTNSSSEYIKKVAEIKRSKMSVAERAIDIRIAHSNMINMHTEFDTSIDDTIVLISSLVTVRQILNVVDNHSVDFFNVIDKDCIDFWKEVENEIKNKL